LDGNKKVGGIAVARDLWTTEFNYLSGMKKNPVDPKPVFNLLEGALTDDMDNRVIFVKGNVFLSSFARVFAFGR